MFPEYKLKCCIVAFEIPDADGERLLHPKDIVQYIVDKFDVIE
jgi:hypothetical protein